MIRRRTQGMNDGVHFAGTFWSEFFPKLRFIRHRYSNSLPRVFFIDSTITLTSGCLVWDLKTKVMFQRYSECILCTYALINNLELQQSRMHFLRWRIRFELHFEVKHRSVQAYHVQLIGLLSSPLQ